MHVKTIVAVSYMDTIKIILDNRLKQYAVIDLLTSYFRLVKRSEKSNLLTLSQQSFSSHQI